MFYTSGKEMGAPTGNWLYDSARELTEMASMQFAVYGLMNPYTYQRPKITPLPNETGLTVPGGTGVAVVPNGTAPALKQPYLPGQYTEYPAAVQGWAQQALPGGGSGIESGSSSGFGNYKFKEGIDVDLRGKGTYKDALKDAFNKTGVSKKDFNVTKWGKDKNGKSFPVEWRANNGAEVSIDLGHSPHGEAPTVPHVGWQTGGKRGNGGALRGHIFVDDVPYNR